MYSFESWCLIPIVDSISPIIPSKAYLITNLISKNIHNDGNITQSLLRQCKISLISIIAQYFLLKWVNGIEFFLCLKCINCTSTHSSKCNPIVPFESAGILPSCFAVTFESIEDIFQAETLLLFIGLWDFLWLFRLLFTKMSSDGRVETKCSMFAYQIFSKPDHVYLN